MAKRRKRDLPGPAPSSAADDANEKATAAAAAAATGAAGEGAAFAFGFFGGAGSSGPEASAQEASEVATRPPFQCVRRAEQHQGPRISSRYAHYTPPAPGEKAERVRVLWEECSSATSLKVRRANGEVLRTSVDHLTPLPGSNNDKQEEGEDGSLLQHIDLLFDGQIWPLPPPIGPTLPSLIYPLSPTHFHTKIFNQKALVIQAGATRLRQLCRDLSSSSSSASSPSSLHVPTLLEHASRIVVWMKAKGEKRRGGRGGGGEIQYLDDAPPPVALACHRAGHSLYFNPPLSVQQPYIKGLLSDLGFFPPSSGGDRGGDIEVFAVRGQHTTPWHWDAQHNFTVQLRGRKKWRVGPSGVGEPMCNYHPASANEKSKEEDVAMAVLCGGGGGGGGGGGERKEEGRSSTCLPSPPPSSISFILRPGAVLYVPAGWWHSVEALSGEEEEEEEEEEETGLLP